MSRAVSHYVSLGTSGSKIALSQNRRSGLRYLFYSMASWIGKLFFLSYPLFAMGDYHIVQQIKEKREWSFFDAFEDSSDLNKYFATVKYVLLLHILFITGMIIIAALSFILLQVARSIDLSLEFERHYIVFVARVLSGSMVVVFLFTLKIYLGPALYLIQSSKDLSLSEALKSSVIILKRQGKIKLFHVQLHYLISVVFLGTLYGSLAYWSYETLTGNAFLVITALLVFLFLKFASRKILAYHISVSNLYIDLIKELVYVPLSEQPTKRIIGTRISKKDVLMTLFDRVTVPEKQGYSSESLAKKEYHTWGD
jgi:hypothetical protein